VVVGMDRLGWDHFEVWSAPDPTSTAWTARLSHTFQEYAVRPALKRGRGWFRVHIERYVCKDTLDICRCRPYCTRKRYPKKNCNLLIPMYFRPEYEGLARLSTLIVVLRGEVSSLRWLSFLPLVAESREGFQIRRHG